MKRFVKKISSILLLVCLLMSLAVPAMSAEKPVIPKMMRGSDGTEVIYALNGTTLTIEETNEKPDYDFYLMEYQSATVLYPFLNTFSDNDRNIALTLEQEDPMVLFAQSSLVRSRKIRTVKYDSNVYKYTVKSGRVTKITVNNGTEFKAEIPLNYKNGKYIGYTFEDAEGWIYISKENYNQNGLKSGMIQLGEGAAYDFTCSLKDGNLDNVTKSGGTSYGPYHETDLFSFEASQLSQITVDIYDGYSQLHQVKRFFYNPDGTLNSVDDHAVDNQLDIDTQKVTQTYVTDGYYSFVY